MDNAIIVDGTLVVLLIAGTLIGARRGLFRSLMGLIVVVAALLGSVWLADVLTDPITDIVAGKIEDSLTRSFSQAWETAETTGVETGEGGLVEALEKYGVSAETVRKLLAPLSSGIRDAASATREKAEETFREAISASVRKVVRGTVHAAVTLAAYLLILLVLKLLTGVLDHAFDLPVLSTFNSAGGAILGFLETAALLFAAVQICAALGWKPITENAEGTYLLPLFLNRSPIGFFPTVYHTA